MITKLAFLFLLGTTMGSNLFMDKLKTAPYKIAQAKSSKYSGCPTGAELAPLICKFLQPYMDMYYKPQLIAPSTYIPPLVVEKCETPQLEMDLPELLELPEPIVEKKPLVIPQPPELPPLTIPKFPIPVIVEEHPATFSENYGSSDTEGVPVVHISAAPQVPTFEVPVIPEIVEQPESNLFKEAIPEIDHNNIDENPIVIPEAPKLPDFIIPEFPVRIEVASTPVLPALDIPSPPKIDEKPAKEHWLSDAVTAPETDYKLVKYEPISIPQPPELPAFVMPELAVIAPDFEDKPIPVPEHFAPLAHIPAPPELPPAVLPEFPVNVDMGMPLRPIEHSIEFAPLTIEEQRAKEPCLSEAIPEVDQNLDNYQSILIPQAPELPELVMPELPPISVEMPYAHVLPAMDIPSPPIIVEQPDPFTMPEFPVGIKIPSAPVPAIDIPSPPMIIEQPAEESYYLEAVPEIDYSIIKSTPISIPAPPELPALVMPEIPVRVAEEPSKVAVTPDLTSAPKLSEFVMPALPSTFVGKPCESSVKLEAEFAVLPSPFERYFRENVKESHNIMIPAAMNHNLYPSPCVYNFVMHHIVPNLASDHFRSLDKVKNLPPSYIPCA